MILFAAVLFIGRLIKLRGRLVKSTDVIKNGFHQGNFVLKSYCRYIKMHSDFVGEIGNKLKK